MMADPNIRAALFEITLVFLTVTLLVALAFGILL